MSSDQNRKTIPHLYTSYSPQPSTEPWGWRTLSLDQSRGHIRHVQHLLITAPWHSIGKMAYTVVRSQSETVLHFQQLIFTAS